MLKWVLVICALPAVVWGMSCEEALQRLKEGNQRYVSDKLIHPDQTSARREAVMAKQHPFAIILGCSDSRVAPEIIFDQGVGDLFVVRVAGNVVGPIELDSIEYAALYLGSRLVLVLGHENCGAVKAVFQHQTKDIEAIAELIEPAIKGADTLEKAVKANVKHVVEQLKNTQVLASLIEQGKVAIVGGYYHLGTGQVEFLPSSPQKS